MNKGVQDSIDARISRMEAIVGVFQEDKASIHESARNIASHCRNFKWWAIGVVVAAPIALHVANTFLLSVIM